MRYFAGVYWEKGSTAYANQDSVVLLQVLTARGRVLMAAVCDGMGGHARGELASRYVTGRLQEWFYETLLRAIRKKKPVWAVRRSLDRLTYHMQEELSGYCSRKELSLGTTMTVLVLWEKTYYLWHLGDTRAYRLTGIRHLAGNGTGAYAQSGRHRTPGIERLTRDHVRGFNQLTKCVGSFGYARPDFRTGILRKGQGILLCSDGFWHHVEERELADTLDPQQIREEEQIARRLREIGSACMRRGEQDNLSAVYIKLDRREVRSDGAG